MHIVPLHILVKLMILPYTISTCCTFVTHMKKVYCQFVIKWQVLIGLVHYLKMKSAESFRVWVDKSYILYHTIMWSFYKPILFSFQLKALNWKSFIVVLLRSFLYKLPKCVLYYICFMMIGKFKKKIEFYSLCAKEAAIPWSNNLIQWIMNNC